MNEKHLIRSMVRLALAAVVWSVPGVVLAQMDSPGRVQLLSVLVDSLRDREALFDLELANPEIEIWSEDRATPQLEVRAPADGVAAIERLGLAYEVVIEDLECVYDDYFNRTTTGDFFDDYATYEEHAAFLHDLAARFPDLATVVDLGPSVEGRSQWMIRITGPGTEKPGVFYHAAQHGNEIMGPCVLTYFARHLLENYESDNEVRALVDGAEWFLVPISNPDGYVRQRRYNAHGADLNRDWGGPGAGEKPFSQPETSHFRDFLLDHQSVAVHSDLHTAGQTIMWAWGHTPDNCADHWTYVALGDELGDVLDDYRGTDYGLRGSLYDTSYPVSGSSVNYCYGVHSITSFTFEIGYSHSMPPEEIRPTCLEFVPGLELLGAEVVDCNQNNVVDWLELEADPTSDCNENLRLDVCESRLDCNENQVLDSCELREAKVEDCNGNAIPDECDIRGHGSYDWNRNRALDECEFCPGIRLGSPPWERRISAFGRAIAKVEDFLVVAAPATDDLDRNQGAVFVMHAPTWEIIQVLTNEPRREQELFGRSLGAQDGLIAVGNAYRPSHGDEEGSVHVFVQKRGTWEREAVLSPEGGTPEDFFGHAVAVHSNLILVGAINDSAQAEQAGAAHVFRRKAGAWEHEQTLRAFDGREYANFGSAVALSDDFAFVAASGGKPDGAVYVFAFDGGAWNLITKLSDGAISQYGRKIAVEGNTLCVSGTNEYVQVLRFEDNAWRDAFLLNPPEERFRIGFGAALDLKDGFLAVGAPDDSTYGGESGAVFAWHLSEENARLLGKFFGPQTIAGDRFGTSVSVDGPHVWASAPVRQGYSNQRYVSHTDLESAPCTGHEVLAANCKSLRDGKRFRPQVRVYAGDPMRSITLRLDDDPMTDRILVLNCQGGGRAVFPRYRREYSTVSILECGVSTEVFCNP